jgi:hypothetical protein
MSFLSPVAAISFTLTSFGQQILYQERCFFVQLLVLVSQFNDKL